MYCIDGLKKLVKQHCLLRISW